MVGVPGKYKGCETCRRRRVKCDNTRPLCRKCLDTGRTCEGYQRQMVFITATIDDGGRCSSHPPRQTPASGKKANTDEDRPRLDAAEPLAPAWDDCITLTNHGVEYRLQITGLQTQLQKLPRPGGESSRAKDPVDVPSYTLPDVQPITASHEFDMKGQCLVHFSARGTDEGEATDGLCAFLYERNASVAIFENTAPGRIPQELLSSVRKQGPTSFCQFPTHHFFVRVYRHSAISLALLSRKETFLASHEWVTVPWEIHPKSLLDRLFDVVVLLPAIFARADRILPDAETQQRRLKAQDLLGNCLLVERQFDDWNSVAVQGTGPRRHSYWVEEQDTQELQIPFVDALAFTDGQSAVMFVYYWMSLLLFHRCVESLHRAIFQPVIDAYPNMYPDLPANLIINPAKYQQGRSLAANVCRALDFALSTTTQPEILIAPLAVVQDFYREINTSSTDGELEVIWCESFRARLSSKGAELSLDIQARKWIEVARF